ncbi:MAG: Smr/MutS family protein [Pararhodobacter sp.]
MARWRDLSKDEEALWQRVARTTRRLQPSPSPAAATRGGPQPDPAAPPPRLPALPAAPPPVNRPARAAPRVTLDLAQPVASTLAQAPVQMDRNTHTRMMRGKLEPEARLDLHGLSLAQAQPVLSGFIMQAHARGLRLVLVITGKGRTTPQDIPGPMPHRAGALRHEVPQWLRAGPLGALVLDLRQAHRSHGGAGAYYVYLRRRR